MARSHERTYIFNIQENILKYVEEVKNFPNLKPNDFKSKSSFSGGTLITLRQDAKIMKLIANGVGFHPTDLGIELLQNRNDINAWQIWRKAGLNVPFFKILFEKFPNETDYGKIRNEVTAAAHSIKLERRLVGSVAKRYLEYVYGIFPASLNRRGRISEDAKKIRELERASYFKAAETQEICTITATKGDKKLFTIYDIPIEKVKSLIE